MRKIEENERNPASKPIRAQIKWDIKKYMTRKEEPTVREQRSDWQTEDPLESELSQCVDTDSFFASEEAAVDKS